MKIRKLKKRNGGFSLVEVIVAMMIMSIVIVSVLAAFTQSSQANLKSRLVQGAETLLSNLVEYVETGRAEVTEEGTGAYKPMLVDFSKSFTDMGTASEQDPASPLATDTVISYTYNSVASGFNTYKVVVTKDIDPSDYSNAEMNEYEIINLGDSTNASMLFDLVAGADDFDRDALSVFRGLHQDYLASVNEYRAGKDLDPITIPEYDGVTEFNFSKYAAADKDRTSQPGNFTEGERSKVARKVFVNVEKKNGGNQVVVNVGFRYVLDSDVAIANDSERTRNYIVYTSVAFDSNTASSGTYLENLYFLYQPTDFTGTKNSLDLNIYNYDIIYEGDGAKLLGAKNGTKGHCNFFIAYQESSLLTVADAAGKKLSERANKDKTVKLKFDGTQAGTAAVDIDVFASCKIGFEDGATSTFSSKNENKLIATQKSKRVVSYKIEIFDKDGRKLTERKTTCMVNK